MKGKTLPGSALFIFCFCLFAVRLFPVEGFFDNSELERGSISSLEEQEEKKSGEELPSADNGSGTTAEDNRTAVLGEEKIFSADASSAAVSEAAADPVNNSNAQSLINSQKETPENKEENSGKEDEKKESEVDPDFTSIQSSGLTLCGGEKWYFEEYSGGQVLRSVLYNKDSLVTQKDFEYEDGKKTAETILNSDKITKIKYNKNGFETEVADYKNKNNTADALIKKTEKHYDNQNRITELSIVENNKTVSTKYVYGADNKVVSETVFENGEKILFVEYTAKFKIVHIFNSGEELNSFKEAL